MYKINNKLLFIIEFSYIDESEYKINDIDKFPIEVLKNCFIVRYPSDRGVKYLPLEERQKLLDSIEYTSIAKMVGLYLTGFKVNEIVLYNPITLKPLRHLQLEGEIPFEKVQDTYKSYIPDYVDIFTDEDLTDIYHKHLQEIYEEAY